MGGGNISLAANMTNNSHNNKKDDGDQSLQPLKSPPLVSSYYDTIRPLRDSVHKLRCMKVIEEGITLPTIVVIGDQSSGKSSVIKSLTGICLRGICSRVPLIIRLQHIPDTVSKLHSLEFQGNTILLFDETRKLEEARILEQINRAIVNVKGISNLPLTLVVRKNSVPDLTIIELPGITVKGQSDNINKKISEILAEYIKPAESIILNVISATADFMTCESIHMAKKFDKNGQRTLHVFTKADEASEDLETIVSTNMGPDYVCVRNRLSGETYEASRTKESNLFETHHSLSKIDKSMVGVHVLAQKLALIQLANISKCLHEIVMKINEDLNICALELKQINKHFTTPTEAMPAFMQIIKMSQKSLYKMVVSCEFDDYPHETQMYFFPRLLEMLMEFSQQLKGNQVNQNGDFLIDEFLLLEEKEEETKGFGLSSSINQDHVLQLLVQRKIDNIFEITELFVSRVWDYIEVVMVRVLVMHVQSYSQLYLIVKMAAKNVVAKMKESFKDRVLEYLNHIKSESFTFHPVFNPSRDELKESSYELKSLIMENKSELNKSFHAPSFGTVSVRHLKGYSDTIVGDAIEIRTKVLATWENVVKCFINWMESHLRRTVYMIVHKEMEAELVRELKGDDEDRYKKMMEEPPFVLTKKWKLKNRTELLKNSKNVIEKVMDKIALHGY